MSAGWPMTQINSQSL